MGLGCSTPSGQLLLDGGDAGANAADVGAETGLVEQSQTQQQLLQKKAKKHR
jgi:hypothetical protein